jgi:ATP-dependent DNA helicase RecG
MAYHSPVPLLDDVRDLIAGIGDDWDASKVESATIDFKQTPDSAGESDRRAPERFIKDLAESAVCFANGPSEGALVLGVRNRARDRQEAVTGVDTGRWHVHSLIQQIHARTSPAITCRATALDVDGKVVYVLVVPEGRDVYSTTEGVYKTRLHDRCMPLEGQQLRGLRALRQQYDWSAQPSGFDESALSRAALEQAARRLREIGSDDLGLLAETDVAAFCDATGLRQSGSGHVNKAAVLLYGNTDALQSLPEWGVNVQTRDTPGGEPRILLRRQTSDVPLVLLLDQLITTIGALTRSLSIRVGATQVELVDYPADALREVFANAFAHRDWEADGVVEVVHSPDELVVASPGGLLPSLRVDRLLHDAAAPRNPALALHMARLRLAEVSGLGLDRVFRAVARLGKEPPLLEDGPRFRVVMPGGAGDEAFTRFLHSTAFPEALARDVDVLMTLTALRHTRHLSAADLSSRLQRNTTDVARALLRMRDAGLVEPTKSTARRAQPKYTLTPSTIAGMRASVTYRTNSIDSDDAKLIRHLRRHAHITNEDVRNYLDCDIMTARNRLQRLRQRGLIDFAPGSPRRGANVAYVKTEKLDALREDGTTDTVEVPTSAAAAPAMPHDQFGGQGQLPFGSAS